MNNATLTAGAFGSEVANLQALLTAKGFKIPTGETSGRFFGPGTRLAITAFQSAQGLGKTGQADAQTVALLTVVTSPPPPSSAPAPAAPAANNRTAITTQVVPVGPPVSVKTATIPTSASPAPTLPPAAAVSKPPAAPIGLKLVQAPGANPPPPAPLTGNVAQP